MRKWLGLVFAAALACAWLAGCGDGPEQDAHIDPGEPPFTGLTSIAEVQGYLYTNPRGQSVDDPVELSVKISASEWVQLFELIKRTDKFVALNISKCYDVPQEFEPWFYGNEKIISISLPINITSIRMNSFYSCTNLKQIILPEGLITIGSSTFSGCTSLGQVTLPASLTRIRDDAFHNCTSLVLVICHASTPPRLDYEVFGGTSAELVIKVPAASVAAYKAAWNDFWCDYADKITAY